MRLIEANVNEYFATARERYEILVRRLHGEGPPWTNDPIFLTWRFCNLFRESDKVTVWIREHVRSVIADEDNILTAMVVCRFFNRIETLEKLWENGIVFEWNTDLVKGLLRKVSPVVGAAYMIKTPTGMNKLDGVCWIVDQIAIDQAKIVAAIRANPTLEAATRIIQQYPFIGPFIAYEVVSDLRYTPLLFNAPDIMTWANAGPGACRGLSWLITGNDMTLKYNSKAAREESVKLMQELLERSQSEDYWPAAWPRWEMREVEHWLCEYYKYVRVKYLDQPMKRRYSWL
jgi:hypothetical protein